MADLLHYIVVARENSSTLLYQYQMNYEDAVGMAGAASGIVTSARWYDNKHGGNRASNLPILPRE